MSDDVRDEKVKAAIMNIASLIVGNNKDELNLIVSYFNEAVKINFSSENSNQNFAAGCVSGSTFNDGKNLNTSIIVNLPLPPNNTGTPEYNWWIVDVHHELFHAFTKILNSNQSYEKTNDNIYMAATGGKITRFIEKDGTRVNDGDIQLSVLFNELTTDLMAYIFAYKRFFGVENVRIDKILHSNQLEIIANTFGYKNGYYELLQLGLLLSEAFTNYPVNYDYIENNGKSFFNQKVDNMQYNDLFNCIMYNPLNLKNKLLDFISDEDLNKLNESASNIITNFTNNGRFVDKENISIVMKIIKNYFDQKIKKMRKQGIDEARIKLLQSNFEERYEYVSKYYNIENLLNINSGRSIS